MRAEVPACCCAGSAVSPTEAHTLSVAPRCCPHAFAVLVTSVKSTQPPFLRYTSSVCVHPVGLLAPQTALVVDNMHSLKGCDALTSVICPFLFRRARIHGQSALLREIHWTRDWFGGRSHPPFLRFLFHLCFCILLPCKMMHSSLSLSKQLFHCACAIYLLNHGLLLKEARQTSVSADLICLLSFKLVANSGPHTVWQNVRSQPHPVCLCQCCVQSCAVFDTVVFDWRMRGYFQPDSLWHLVLGAMCSVCGTKGVVTRDPNSFLELCQCVLRTRWTHFCFVLFY